MAGGIGITPLLSMARFLDKSGLPYELHYFVRSDDQVAFKDQLDTLAGKVTIHAGLTRDAIGQTIKTTPGPHRFAEHVYVCGPGSMLETVRSTATDLGWPEDAIPFEYFPNTKTIDYSPASEL